MPADDRVSTHQHIGANPMMLPAGLQELNLLYGFDQPIIDVIWPASLQTLHSEVRSTNQSTEYVDRLF